MTPLEQELFNALKEREDAEKEEDEYRFTVIANYPMDKKVEPEVRTKWQEDLKVMATRQYKARKTAQELINRLTILPDK